MHLSTLAELSLVVQGQRRSIVSKFIDPGWKEMCIKKNVALYAIILVKIILMRSSLPLLRASTSSGMNVICQE